MDTTVVDGEIRADKRNKEAPSGPSTGWSGRTPFPFAGHQQYEGVSAGRGIAGGRADIIMRLGVLWRTRPMVRVSASLLTARLVRCFGGVGVLRHTKAERGARRAFEADHERYVGRDGDLKSNGMNPAGLRSAGAQKLVSSADFSASASEVDSLRSENPRRVGGALG